MVWIGAENLAPPGFDPWTFQPIVGRYTDYTIPASHMGEKRGIYRVLVGKPEGKRPLGRPRSRWDDNIKMDLQKIVCGVWTGSIWLRIGTGGGQL